MIGSRQQVTLGAKVILKSNVDESAPDKSWGEVIGKTPSFHLNPGEL